MNHVSARYIAPWIMQEEKLWEVLWKLEFQSNMAALNWCCHITSEFNHLLKHTTTLFALSDHYILSREWIVIVDQVQTNYHVGLSGVTELLILRDPHYGRICFKSVTTLGALHS